MTSTLALRQEDEGKRVVRRDGGGGIVGRRDGSIRVCWEGGERESEIERA